MGMFDFINFEGKEYQTKDTPEQFMETYEIRGDELWFNEVQRKWVEDRDSFFAGYLEPVSSEWKFLNNFDGLIRFYRQDENRKWIEYKALFMDGKIIKLVEVPNDE